MPSDTHTNTHEPEACRSAPHVVPDRGILTTEQRLDSSGNLDALTILDTLRLMNDQDAAVAGAVRAAIPAIAGLVESAVEAMRRGGRLIYLGAGTSGRLGVLDASECPPTFHSDPAQVVAIIAGGDEALRRSSEGAEDDPNGAAAPLSKLNVSTNDVVVGIAAGGTTPFVWGALRLARTRGAKTALVCCVQESAVPAQNAARRIGPTTAAFRLPDHVVRLPVGPEVLTGSTRMKAGTATKMVLNMLTTGAMVLLGKTYGNLMVDLRATNTKLVDRARRIVTALTDLTAEEAEKLLARCEGEVKTAIAAHLCRMAPQQARRLLEQSDGRLRQVLEDHAN